MNAESRAQVELPDGRVAKLAFDDLLRVLAWALPNNNRVRVIINGQRADLIALIEAAVEADVGTITAVQAREVARTLKLAFEPAPKARSTAIAPYDLRSQLARLSGNWVAIDADRVIAHDRTLGGLLAKTVDQRATVAFVPVREASRLV